MALQAGKIQIDFTCNYPSHRVAWQLSTDPPGVYSIVEPALPNCAGGGVAATVYVDVMLDHDTCDVLTFQGYIQPTCEDVSSLIGRIPWTCNFTPDEDCYSAEIECILTNIKNFEMTNAGTGYVVGAPPVVTVSAGLATAVAVVADDGLKTTDITSLVDGAAGTHTQGVYNGITVTATTGGGNIAATFVTVEVDAAGNIVNVRPDETGFLSASVGDSHAIGDTITLGGAVGLTAGAQIDILTLYDTQTILEVQLTLNDNYAVAPTVSIAAPGAGVQATADVVMNQCSDFNKVQCDTNPSAIALNLGLGETMIVCGDHAVWTAAGNTFVEVPADYSQAHSGCCYDCVMYSFTLLSSPGWGEVDPIVRYLDCADGQWKTHTLTANWQVCAVEGAVSVYDPDFVGVTVGAGPSC